MRDAKTLMVAVLYDLAATHGPNEIDQAMTDVQDYFEKKGYTIAYKPLIIPAVSKQDVAIAFSYTTNIYAGIVFVSSCMLLRRTVRQAISPIRRLPIVWVELRDRILLPIPRDVRMSPYNAVVSPGDTDFLDKVYRHLVVEDTGDNGAHL